MACERDPTRSISISMNQKTRNPPRCSWKKRRFGAWCITCSIAAKCLDCCWMFECREESSFLQKIFQKFSYKVPCLSVLDDSIDDDLSADDFPESLRDECTIQRNDSLHRAARRIQQRTGNRCTAGSSPFR